MADEDNELIGLRRLEDGTNEIVLWDGGHFKGRTRNIDQTSS